MGSSLGAANYISCQQGAATLKVGKHWARKLFKPFKDLENLVKHFL